MNERSRAISMLMLMATFALTGCGSKDGGKQDRHADSDNSAHTDEESRADQHDDDAPMQSLRMDADAMTVAGVRIAVLTASALHEQLRAPGEVIDNAYGTTLITPRVESLVVRRHARLGDEVSKGAALVTLSSIEVAATQGALSIAEQDWKRVRALGREAVSARRYDEAQVVVEQARATARAYGIEDASKVRASGEFTLYAPHAGRLTEDAFVIGERIEPGHSLFRLVDESIVWIDATLPAESARRIVVGSEARIVLGERTLTGKVVQRGHRTSEDTRNALVRIEVANTADQLHSGDYVDVYVDAAGSNQALLSAPTSALLQLEGETVLFRHDPDDALTPVAVRTGDVIGDRTVLLDGVVAGDAIVIEGAYALKARILKSQLGEGHAH